MFYVENLRTQTTISLTKLNHHLNSKSMKHFNSIITTLFSFFILGFVFTQTSRLSGNYNSPYQDSYQRVSAGYTHYLELKNGKLYASGSNSHGQLGTSTQQSFSELPVQIGTQDNWVRAAAGNNFSLGIKADGTLWAWGKNDKGQLGLSNTTQTNTPTQIGSDKWFSISVGSDFVLAIKSDGTLWAWGDNSMGQLGNNTDDYLESPIQIGTDNNWWKISAGYKHCLAIKSNGTLWAWGDNTLGQVGNGATSFTGEATPIQIGTNHWIDISSGGFFSTGIRDNGTLWAWGDNYYGQIANGNTNGQLLPTQIENSNKWKTVFAGRNHIVGLKTDGTIWSWGDELGEGLNQPGIVSQKTNYSGIVQASAGDGFSFVLSSNGKLYSWGKNDVGQLGQGNTISYATPTFNNSVSEEVIAASSAHWFTTFTLYSNGTVKGWGANDDFELGVDTNAEDQTTPIEITTAENNNISILPAISHTLVVKDNGTLWGWGDAEMVGNGNGVLEIATQVNLDNDWRVVTTGSYATAGIKNDGTLWMWGSNYEGELGLGDTDARIVPVQVGTDNNWRNITIGASHTIAIKSDGTLWGWGRNYAGEAGGGDNTASINTPQQIGNENDWVYISAGSMSSFAIKSNGTLWGWGASSTGQLGINPIPTKVTEPTQIGNESFIQARVANWSGAGITADGNLLAWGNLNMVFGELGMGDNINYPTPTLVPNQSDIVHISGGQCHKTIIKPSRQSICVTGRNANGELGIGSTDMSKNFYVCDVAIIESQNITQIDSVVVEVQNNLSTEITTENGTLQLLATVFPSTVNQNVTWTVISGNSFLSTDQNGLVTALLNGTAIVRATSVEDNTKYDEIAITVNVSYLGLGKLENNVSVYPNPINEVVTITFENAASSINLKVVDLYGRQVIENSYSSSDSIQLNCSELTSGVYQIIIQTEVGTITRKIFKQ